ncbi:glycosyltransferase [Microbacterium gilvum]|uniref:Glycosyl transferase family 28 C-terminal domain-containing protein n=1 Tax=Microbacterium gilvum TaxID=1336204 RepID=A0ABP9AGT4_9MICO
MSGGIGWYVHHHGLGHATRLRAVAAHLPGAITCFSSLARPDDLPANCSWVRIPLDDASAAPVIEPEAGGLLHWAPIGHPGHAGRLAAIAAWIGAHRPSAFVVDVSAEVALLTRLLGVRTVLMAQPGIRDDRPHRLAFDAASRIVAPWPRDLLRPAHLDRHLAKVVFTGGITRFAGRRRAAPGDDVVVLGGLGGSAITTQDIAAAQDVTGRTWRAVGAGPGAPWVADPWQDISEAGVVVSWAGQNAIADLAAAGARAVVIPQERPFDEQRETARALARAGLALVLDDWPMADEWPAVLDGAAAVRPEWERWEIDDAAARAAHAILETAGGR